MNPGLNLVSIVSPTPPPDVTRARLPRPAAPVHEARSTLGTPDHQTALLARCASGDDDACAELVAMHQGIVFNLAFRMLGDRDEALDLSQDVFLRVFRTLSTFRADSTLRTWIHRIVVTQSMNRQRTWRRRRRGRQVSLDEYLDARGEIETPADVRPDQLLARKQAATGLRSALARLPPDQRTVIVLREIDGLRYKEIACALGLDVSTVKSRLTRARLALRAQLTAAPAR